MNIIQINEDELPEKLRVIKNPPNKLYAVGNINLLYKKSFAIVGTRRITDYGIRNCRHFAEEFTQRSIPITSGMAIGTDTIAHKTALENYGETIAVLGSGFNCIFPKENITLFEQIVDKGGLIITEYEPNVKPNKDNFPKRNRIITGISEGILVIEAGYRSGTSITAKHAKEQEKLVFALPGRIDSDVGRGVNELIKRGAILTTGIADILKYYPEFNKIPKQIEKRKLDSNYEKIINVLKDGEKGIQEIISLSGITVSNIFEILINMEIENIIFKNYLGKYALKQV